MNNKLYKIVKIAIAAIALIGIFLFIRVAMNADNPVELSDVASPLVTFSMILLFLAIIITVLFSIIGLLKNPKALKKTLLSLGVLAGLFFLAYVMSSSAEVTDTYGKVLKDGAAGVVPKRVGAIINYSYILGIIAVACVLWGSLKGMFSK